MAYTIFRKRVQGKSPQQFGPGDEYLAIFVEMEQRYFQWKRSFLIPPKKPVFRGTCNLYWGTRKKFRYFYFKYFSLPKTEHLPMRNIGWFKD